MNPPPPESTPRLDALLRLVMAATFAASLLEILAMLVADQFSTGGGMLMVIVFFGLFLFVTIPGHFFLLIGALVRAVRHGVRGIELVIGYLLISIAGHVLVAWRSGFFEST